MRIYPKMLAVVCGLGLAAGALATNFVYDTTSLPATKTNLNNLPGGADPTKYIQGSDYNAVTQAAYDLRTAIKDYKFYNVRAYGALGDGSTNDTAAVAAAYAAIVSAGKGQLFFPAGSYKMNLAVTMSNISLVGSGKGVTILKPWDLTIPTLKLGDGTTAVAHILVSQMKVEGTTAGATSDGLYIHGANNVDVTDFEALNFGRDNIRIDNTASVPTYFIRFAHLTSKAARGSGFKAVQLSGSTFLTSIYIDGADITGHSTSGSTALWIDGVRLSISNAYIECGGDRVGHVFLGFASSGGESAHLQLANVDIDGETPETNVAIEIDKTPQGRVMDYVFGQWTTHNFTRWGDGTLQDMRPLFLNTNYSNSFLNNPHLTGSLYLMRQDDFSETEDPTLAPALLAKGPHSARYVQLLDSSLRLQLNNSQPLQFNGGASMWRSSGGDLRYDSSHLFPSTDGSGRTILPYHVNVLDFAGVDRSGATDSTAGIAAAYAAVRASYNTNGELFFPNGIYKFNLVVDHAGITIRGETMNTTTFEPNSTSSPVLQIGDGTTDVGDVVLNRFTVVGTGSGASSDGIKLLGVERVRISEVDIQTFGRDNLAIYPSKTRPTYDIGLNHFSSRQAHGASLHVMINPSDAQPWIASHAYTTADYVSWGGGNTYHCITSGTTAASGGPTTTSSNITDGTAHWAYIANVYTTVVHASDFFIEGYNDASARALKTDAVLDLVNGWFEIPSSAQGHVQIDWNKDPGVPAAIQTWANTHLDSSTSTDTLIETNNLGSPGSESYFAQLVHGVGVSIDGKYKRDDGNLVDVRGNDAWLVQPRIVNQYVEGFIGFNDQTFLDETEGVQSSVPTVKLYRVNTGATAALKNDGSAFRPMLTLGLPLQGSVNGAMWRDSVGELRWAPTSWNPSADSDGKPLARIVTAPTNSNDPCEVGQVAFSSTHDYACTAHNTWVRGDMATW